MVLKSTCLATVATARTSWLAFAIAKTSSKRSVAAVEAVSIFVTASESTIA